MKQLASLKFLTFVALGSLLLISCRTRISSYGPMPDKIHLLNNVVIYSCAGTDVQADNNFIMFYHDFENFSFFFPGNDTYIEGNAILIDKKKMIYRLTPCLLYSVGKGHVSHLMTDNDSIPQQINGIYFPLTLSAGKGYLKSMDSGGNSIKFNVLRQGLLSSEFVYERYPETDRWLKATNNFAKNFQRESKEDALEDSVCNILRQISE